MKWALHQDPKGGTGASRSACQHLLIVLADHASAAHLVWPSEQTLADRTHLARRQVRRVLHALEAEGLILDTGRRHKRGTVIWLLPVENLGTTGDTMSPPGGDTMSIREDTMSRTGDTMSPHWGHHVPRSSQEPRTEPPKNQGQDSPGERTPGPDVVPEQVRRAVWRGTRRMPEAPLTPEQLEARRREQLKALAPLVREQLEAEQQEQHPDE